MEELEFELQLEANTLQMDFSIDANVTVVPAPIIDLAYGGPTFIV